MLCSTKASNAIDVIFDANLPKLGCRSNKGQKILALSLVAKVQALILTYFLYLCLQRKDCGHIIFM